MTALEWFINNVELYNIAPMYIIKNFKISELCDIVFTAKRYKLILNKLAHYEFNNRVFGINLSTNTLHYYQGNDYWNILTIYNIEISKDQVEFFKLKFI
jgi:hypothetical protein